MKRFRSRLAAGLFWLAYGFAPLWLAALMAQAERRGDLTASTKTAATEKG